MRAYRNRLFQIGDEKRLRHYFIYPEFYDKGIKYDVLVDEIVNRPEIIAAFKDKPFAKDVMLVFESCLKNSKVKEFSHLYQYNDYLQYLVTRYENFILKDGFKILEKFSLIKSVQFAASRGKSPSFYKDLEKVATVMAKRKWEKSFLKDNPALCYFPTEDDSFKTFRLNRNGDFTNKDKSKFSNLLSKLNLTRYLWKTEIDLEKTKPLFDEIKNEYEIEYFERKLLPIIKEVFGEECSKATLTNLLNGEAEDVAQMAVSGHI